MFRTEASDKTKQLFFLLGLILLLTLAVVRTNYGIWNADIPLGDEASHIEQSFRLYKTGQWSRNLYFDAYILFFRHITTDPVIAHCCLRFISSLSSVIALFLLLSVLNQVSLPGAYVMALFWNLNLLNTPLIQFGNINLFVFAMVCFAGYLWLLESNKYFKPFSILILLAAILIRHEYVLLLFLLTLQRSVVRLTQLRKKGVPDKRFIPAFIAAAILITVTAAALFPGMRSHALKLVSYVDTYLFLGLKQCYSAFAVSRNSALHLEPYTEFDILMSRKFPGATGFFSAIMINPLEVLKYFSLNGFSNLTHIYYTLPSHSIVLPSGLVTNGLTGGATTGDFVSGKFAGYPILWLDQLLTLLWIAFGSLWLLGHRFRTLPLKRLWTEDDSFYVISMAAVAITAILIHIPDPRYWIMVIPMLFWGGAALLSNCCAGLEHRLMMVIAVLLSFVFVNPVFTSTLNSNPDRNRDVALALRNRLKLTSAAGKVRVLGYYPGPMLSFAIPGQWAATNNMDVRSGSSYEGLVSSKKYDLIIVDGYLRKTDQYDKEKIFFDKLLKNPEIFGYQLLLNGTKRDGPIQIFQIKS